MSFLARAAFLASALALGASALGCSVPVTIETGVGPFEYEISATRVAIPDPLREPSNNTLRSVPCMADTDCPQIADGPAIRCAANMCDPDPFSFELASDVIDLDMNSTVRMFGNHLTRVSITRASFTAVSNGFQNAVGPTDLFWGPPAATDTSSAGVFQLGTIPVLDFGGQSEVSGDVQLDTTGIAALSDYVVGTARQFRLFVRPRVDVVPGGPLPAGSVRIQVQMIVLVQGQLVR